MGRSSVDLLIRLVNRRRLRVEKVAQKVAQLETLASGAVVEALAEDGDGGDGKRSAAEKLLGKAGLRQLSLENDADAQAVANYVSNSAVHGYDIRVVFVMTTSKR